ncbi:MAG: 4Fe-4S dicluster domain-containing protein, partial [Blautia sp.]
PGCPNACIKARLHDFGIIGMTMPQYDPNRCVTCRACIKGCDKLSVNVLQEENYRIVRNEEKCIGCGVCVTKCPTRAWSRSAQKYYRLTIMGRTGKRNPRLGEDFLVWVDEDTIVKVILNTYRFVEKYIDPGAPGGKEHIGYIIDRVGFQEYKKWALEGVDLLPETIVKDPIYWNGIHYR